MRFLHLFISLLITAFTLGEEIKLAFFCPKKFYYFWNVSTSIGGLAAAVQKVENDASLSPTKYTIEWRDSDCNSKSAIGQVFDLIGRDNFKPDLIVGPSCSPGMDPVSQLGSHLNIPVFGWISSDPSLEDKEKHNTLVRLLGPLSALGEGFIQTFNLFGWKRAFLISTAGPDHGEMGRGVKTAFQNKKKDGFVIARWEQDVEEKASSSVISDIYDRVQKEARIVILAIPKDDLRSWMLGASDKDMTSGDYVFIYVNQELPSKQVLADIQSTSFWKKGDSRDSDARAAYENIFILYTKTLNFKETEKFEQDFKLAASSARWSSFKPTTPDIYSFFLHDAILVHAKLATLVGSVSDGKKIFERAKNFYYPSGATGNIVFGSSADRNPDFWLFDLNSNGNFTIIAETVTTQGGGQRKMDILQDPKWGDGKTGVNNAPPDVPSCGFENENCESYLSIIIPSVVGGVVLLAAIIGFLVYRQFRYEREIASMVWKLNYSDLHVYTTGHIPGSQLNFRSLSTNLRKSRIGSSSIAETIAGQIFITIANYKGNHVAIKNVRKNRIKIERDLLLEMKNMNELKHGNLAHFVGACVDPPNICSVWEYCTKGSLQDVIYNENISLDDMFKFSIVNDVLRGLIYLHDSAIKYHGRLKSSNVVIDGRWACKLTDFGLKRFLSGEDDDPELTEASKNEKLCWTAPEVLRNESNQNYLADIYATGIIMKETFCRNSPYTEYEHEFDTIQIIQKLKEGTDPPFRPNLSDFKIESEKSGLVDLIESCWTERPTDRPSLSHILKTLGKLNPNKKANVMDNMIAMMEKYSNHLEDLVAERTVQLDEEKKKTESLLYRMLPQSVADELKIGKPIQAESFDSVTIYFSDIVSFTTLAAESTPLQVVDLLNDLYTLFDEAISNHDVYKVETIGDAYMLVSGLPKKNKDEHAVEIADCAMDLLSGVLKFKVPHKPDFKLRIRIGLHSGPVVAGVVGLTMPRYCLFGDTVNTASRMESNGQASRIHLSNTCYKCLSKFSGYRLADRGEIEVKGKGLMRTYWLYGKENYDKELPDFSTLSADDLPRPVTLPVTQGKKKKVPTATLR